VERLSSYATFSYKFVFPCAWIAIFGSGTLMGLFAPDSGDFAGRGTMLFALVVGSLLLWWVCARLKRVRLRGETLLVSNYIREIEVPLSEVTGVKQPLYWTSNLRPVTVEFASETRFGRSIVFMPPISFNLFVESPVARRLRELTASESAISA
jgi:hypothetical protein